MGAAGTEAYVCVNRKDREVPYHRSGSLGSGASYSRRKSRVARTEGLEIKAIGDTGIAVDAMLISQGNVRGARTP